MKDQDKEFCDLCFESPEDCICEENLMDDYEEFEKIKRRRKVFTE